MRIQEVLLEITNGYAGHPYYVTGNAILHAMADGLSYPEQQALRVSHGMFVPNADGRFPKEHSQPRYMRMAFGTSLKPVEAYQDLFLFRRVHHPWIYEGVPRDAFNTHGVKRHREMLLFDHRNYVPTKKRVKNPDRKRSVRSGRGWLLHFYIHQDDNDQLPIEDSLLDGLQLGGSRNYGFGLTRLKQTRVVDIDDLDFSAIEYADGHVIELVTPFVIESEYPHTNDDDVPWWWDQSLNYRRRTEKLVEQREQYELTTIDHGQVTRYEGRDPVQTAVNGVARIGTHSKYGFGEFMIRPTG